MVHFAFIKNYVLIFTIELIMSKKSQHIYRIAMSNNMLWSGVHCGLERYLIHESQDLAYVGQHDLWMKALTKLKPICRHWHIRQLFRLSLNIHIHSRSYSSKSHYKHYPSRYLIPCSFTQSIMVWTVILYDMLSDDSIFRMARWPYSLLYLHLNID